MPWLAYNARTCFFNLYILVVFVIAIIKTVTNACIYVSVRFICLSIFHHGGCVWGLGMAVNLLINSFLFFFYSACLPAYFPFFFSYYLLEVELFYFKYICNKLLLYIVIFVCFFLLFFVFV